MLQFSWDAVFLSIFDQPGTSLVVGECHAVFYTLKMNSHYPGIVTGTGVWPGLAADGDGFNDIWIVLKERPQIHSRQHWFDYNAVMVKRERKVDGKPFLRHSFILACDRNGQVIPFIGYYRYMMLPVQIICSNLTIRFYADQTIPYIIAYSFL